MNQAKDSGAKFIVSSQKCAAKSVDVKDQMPQQISVMLPLTQLICTSVLLENMY